MNINAAVIKMQGRSRMDAAASGALGSAASSHAGGARFSLANAGSGAGVRGSGLGEVVGGAPHPRSPYCHQQHPSALYPRPGRPPGLPFPEPAPSRPRGPVMSSAQNFPLPGRSRGPES